MKDLRALRIIMRGALIAVLALMLFAEGSVRAEPLHLLSTIAFALGAISLLFLDRRSGAFSPVVMSLGMALVLAAWGLFQAGFDFGLVSPHPVWQSASEIIGPIQGAISIAPSDTIEAIIPITLPFVVFASCYILFDSDGSVSAFLGLGVAIAVLGAVIAIVQLEFAPDTLLFGTKRYYLDSLTAFFVNRNTSATYLAMQMIVAAGFCLKYAGSVDARRLFVGLAGPVQTPRSGTRAFAPALLLSLVATAILFTALMLTKSRAGAAAGLIGLALFLLIAAYYGPYRRRARGAVRSSGSIRKTTVQRRLTRILAVLLVLVVAAGAFAGRAVLRAEIRGADDERFCLYPGMVRLLHDNWEFGTGFGTFRDAFSPYRPPECEVLSIIDRAHNFYLEALISAGVVVIPLAVIAVSFLLVVIFRGIRFRKSMRWLPIAGLGVLVTVILHSIVDFSIQIPGFAVWFAAVLACVARVSLERRAE